MSEVINANASKRSRTKKIAWVTAGLLLVGGGVAFAYWTVSGTGTGTATTGTSAAITVNQTTVVTAMHPGDEAQILRGTFTNTTNNDGPAYVGTVTASIESVVDSGSVAIVGCDATDYTLENAAMSVNADVPAGSDQGAWTGASIKFNNKGTNQDACKGATVNLTYTIS